MRSRTADDLPGRCKRCWLKEELCLCSELPRLQTHTQVLVLRHRHESYKSTNTARLVPLVLERCQLIDYDGPSTDIDRAVELLPDAWLCFPGEGRLPHPDAVGSLVLIDGTWRETRRMLRRLPGLARLPLFSLPAPTRPAQRLRRSPTSEGRSTLEAVADALGHLEGEPVAEALHRVHAQHLLHTLVGRGTLPRSALGARPP